jgi:membrane protein implicated in regulation of membrane protease activity
MGFFEQLSTFVVFLGIAGFGFFFLMISLVFGEIFNFDHDFEHGPGFFSLRVLSVFSTSFGGFGALAVHFGASTITAASIGLVGGFCFATLIYLFGRFLHGQQATSEVRIQDVVGQTARVTVTIPPGGIGQVRCRVGESLVDKIARTRDGGAVPENSVVTIEEVLGETVIVRTQ